jgi:hypothetical protein
MTADIRPVEVDGQFWVHISLDGSTNRYGPYADSNEAEIMATRLAAVCRALNTEVVLAAPGAKRHP